MSCNYGRVCFVDFMHVLTTEMMLSWKELFCLSRLIHGESAMQISSK
jgi:hypothetical protein